jgi:hypothetical protein
MNHPITNADRNLAAPTSSPVYHPQLVLLYSITSSGAPPEPHLPRYGLFVPDVPPIRNLSIVRSL